MLLGVVEKQRAGAVVRVSQRGPQALALVSLPCAALLSASPSAPPSLLSPTHVHCFHVQLALITHKGGYSPYGPGVVRYPALRTRCGLQPVRVTISILCDSAGLQCFTQHGVC